MYTYIYIYIHIYINIYKCNIHTHIHICVCTYIHVYIHIYSCSYIYVLIYIHVCICVCVCVCVGFVMHIYTYTYMHIYTYICIYTYTIYIYIYMIFIYTYTHLSTCVYGTHSCTHTHTHTHTLTHTRTNAQLSEKKLDWWLDSEVEQVVRNQVLQKIHIFQKYCSAQRSILILNYSKILQFSSISEMWTSDAHSNFIANSHVKEFQKYSNHAEVEQAIYILEIRICKKLDCNSTRNVDLRISAHFRQ